MRKEYVPKVASLFSCAFLVGTIALPDVWLRVMTRWIGAYSIYEPAPNLFTLAWAILLTAVVTLPPSRSAGRILYGLVYGICCLYAAVQYGSYLIFGRFLYVSDFMFAGEGADYLSWAMDLLTPGFLMQIGLMFAVGAMGIWLFPGREGTAGKGLFLRCAVILLCVLAMQPIPKLYGEAEGEERWDGFSNLALEYERFTNANTDMELTGMYQYLFRGIWIQLGRLLKDHSEELVLIDNHFGQIAEHSDNSMTGVLEGKNVIVVMMESVDDWMLTPEDMPTVYRMVTNGINFTNFYTPEYSSGYTFNTEFAFNTGVYPYANGNTAYFLARNDFSCGVAARFSDAGYAVNSYHEGTEDFYNRGVMHRAWGYEQYHSYQDYAASDISYLDDRYLTTCDPLYEDMVSRAPFFSFVITYSPHLPYTDDDALTQTALELYPDYDVDEEREIAILRAKARLTDDMFNDLLMRLEEDSLLEDTVIVGFGDHYAYGLSDKERLLELSQGAGSSILEKTPAFIYCAGADLSMEVDKVMQITDLAPTMMNLFGLEVPKEIMGRDIFDEAYEGHVIFAGSGWLNAEAYVKDGAVIWNHGMTEEELAQMDAYVRLVYQINDAILDSDYYAQKG